MTYALQYYDKVMIGHAAIFGLREDLGIAQGLQYSNCTMIFFCGFILGCYPVSDLSIKGETDRTNSDDAGLHPRSEASYREGVRRHLFPLGYRRIVHPSLHFI